mmetsp:Transcript_104266/g.299833  ORF Transcript_104266/g.299833 Transcript_104266/m.299833 type:complete len:253 (-) Transcript_104266:150-908(-)
MISTMPLVGDCSANLPRKRAFLSILHSSGTSICISLPVNPSGVRKARPNSSTPRTLPRASRPMLLETCAVTSALLASMCRKTACSNFATTEPLASPPVGKVHTDSKESPSDGFSADTCTTRGTTRRGPPEDKDRADSATASAVPSAEDEHDGDAPRAAMVTPVAASAASTTRPRRNPLLNPRVPATTTARPTGAAEPATTEGPARRRWALPELAAPSSVTGSSAPTTAAGSVGARTARHRRGGHGGASVGGL